MVNIIVRIFTKKKKKKKKNYFAGSIGMLPLVLFALEKKILKDKTHSSVMGDFKEKQSFKLCEHI